MPNSVFTNADSLAPMSSAFKFLLVLNLFGITKSINADELSALSTSNLVVKGTLGTSL